MMQTRRRFLSGATLTSAALAGAAGIEAARRRSSPTAPTGASWTRSSGSWRR